MNTPPRFSSNRPHGDQVEQRFKRGGVFIDEKPYTPPDDEVREAYMGS